MKILKLLPLLALIIGVSANSCMGMNANKSGVEIKVGTDFVMGLLAKVGSAATHGLPVFKGFMNLFKTQKAIEADQKDVEIQKERLKINEKQLELDKKKQDQLVGALLLAVGGVGGLGVLTVVVLAIALIIITVIGTGLVLGTVLLYKWIKKLMQISPIIKDTSLKPFSPISFVKGMFAFVKKLFIGKKLADLNAWQRLLVYPAKTLKQLNAMVYNVALRKQIGETLPVVGLFGTPGVGKTIFATQVFPREDILDMDHIFICGSDIRKNEIGEAIKQVTAAIDRAMRSPKRVVFIIDEADGILVSGDKFADQFMSFFKTVLDNEKVRKHILFVYTTNTKTIADAIRSRTGYMIEVLQPGSSELTKLLVMHLNKHIVEGGSDDVEALNALGNSQKIYLKLDAGVFSPEFLDEMGKLLLQANASGRTVDLICNHLKMETRATSDKTLTPAMIKEAVEKWGEDKDYFDKQDAQEIQKHPQQQQMVLMPVMMQPGMQQYMPAN